MYDYLQGEIVGIGPTRIVLDVNGVGYAVEIPLSTYESLPQSGEVRILTHLHVREDSQKLYGFHREEERTLFVMLQTVSGIGPTLALTLLSRAGWDELRDAILEDRVEFLKGLKGVGPKTAVRLVTELKDKMAVLGYAREGGGHSAEGSAKHDAVQALEVLGYTPKASQAAVAKVMKELPTATVGEIVRAALKLA